MEHTDFIMNKSMELIIEILSFIDQAVDHFFERLSNVEWVIRAKIYFFRL